MKVLYLTNVPSPYRVEYFNSLSEECQLTVIYEKPASDERDKKWTSTKAGGYEVIFLRGISTGVDSSFSFEIIKYLNGNYDVIVLCGISSPTEIIAIEYCKLKKKRYFLESDGGIAKSGKGLKEWVKKKIVAGASGYFSTCKRHDDYYMAYGAIKSNLYRYPFSSVLEKDLVKESISKDEKKQIRLRLGIKDDRVILSVGQFIYRKGFDVLLQSAAELPHCAFYIVGGEATIEYLNYVKTLDLHNVFFYGFKTKEELKEYYDAADLFVLPTREDIWGLVVNEAMSRGLPVITTDNCNAGLEMIKDGINGFLIPTNDVTALSNSIKKYFDGDTIEMAKSALETAKNYTIEKMVYRHIEVFKD